MFTNGFNLGLSAIGFLFTGNSLTFNLGIWLGLTLFGAIQGAFALWMFRKFINGGN